ncbi:PucR family transcriptional regulator [Ornithinicoccus hortensis]|uniref:CdaR family transcriptional regulator n=1 Tax=Ornithinicoccus hortensis TaxID=82346 RepID=A0A542YSB8_9MICO|nr:helix-turn-helix domain-containing protein [Ornithinicoccus hortensis]TQL50941.1 CdaR family transcriptional regulator [Ornithinicoccus hortensis]
MDARPQDGPPEVLTRNSGAVATAAAQRMEREHAWYRALSPADRSWVGLVAQAGISAFLAWYRHPESPAVTANIFGTAPAELAHTITLRQTLDLVRTTIDVVEDELSLLAPPGQEAAMREALLRYSREVAFAAAQVYASAAESRGAWDARLESLVVHTVVRGEADETLSSRAAELGWESVSHVAVLAGAAPGGGSSGVAEGLRTAARRSGIEALGAVQGSRLICILGNVEDPLEFANGLIGHFGPGPIVVGPTVPHLFAAGRSARSALSGLDVARAWPEAPRPVLAVDLLAERALNGEAPARRLLTDRVYRRLVDGSPGLLETASAYLESGRSLEATSRVLFVHPNTVRYRLHRIEETIDLDLTLPRDAWVAQVGLSFGRLSEDPRSTWRRSVGPDRRTSGEL